MSPLLRRLHEFLQEQSCGDRSSTLSDDSTARHGKAGCTDRQTKVKSTVKYCASVEIEDAGKTASQQWQAAIADSTADCIHSV